MIADPTVFATVFAALFAGHQVGDHWIQSSCQAAAKGCTGSAGRIACVQHVASLTATKLVFLTPVVLLLGLTVHPAALVAGLAVDAASHYWADRRTTLARLADLVGKGEFYRLGAPRPGRDDNPTLGTGSYALDQSWHIAFLVVAALITAIGGGA
jgi:isoaspartyl peptidase/L-asparaginase-like protein (Ntn-hydrolase superfamily)